MFYREIDTKIKNIKAFVIDEQGFNELTLAIKEKLIDICYGTELYRGIEEDGKYAEVCRELSTRIDLWQNSGRGKNVYGMIAEMIMHLAAPTILGPNYKSISVLLSSHNRDIKNGFDLNFFDEKNKLIWFGEVKSSVSRVSRVSLAEKAKEGLKKFFAGLSKSGKDYTGNRWDAALAEASHKIGSEKICEVKRLIEETKKDILKEGQKQHAVLMTMNYGDNPFPESDFSDLKGKLAKIMNENLFEDCIIISAAKKTYDDIISFIEEEGAR